MFPSAPAVARLIGWPRSAVLSPSVLVSAAALVLAGIAPGQTPAAKESPAANEGRLPNGAIARLGSARFRFEGRAGEIVFAPDGTQVAVVTYNAVSLIDTRNGRTTYRVPGDEETLVDAVRFVDGGRLAVGTHGEKTAQVAIHDLAAGRVVSTARFMGEHQVHVIDFTPDGTAALIEDRFVRVYLSDLETGKSRWSIDEPDRFAVRLTPDGGRLVLADSRVAVAIDGATGKEVRTYPSPGRRFDALYRASLAPDGRLAVCSEKGDAVAVVSTEKANPVRLLAADRGGDRYTFSPDGRFLVGPHPDGTQVWDLRAGDRGPVARLGAAHAAGFSPDGKVLCLADEGVLSFLSVGDWKPLPPAADPPGPVFRVWFGPQDRTVVGHTGLGWVTWPTRGGPTSAVPGDALPSDGPIMEVSADGRTGLDAVPASKPGERPERFALRVTDLATGAARLIPFRGQFHARGMSPDGRYVSAVVGEMETVWDTATGKETHRRKLPGGPRVFATTPATDGRGLSLSVAGQRAEIPADPLGPQFTGVFVTDHRSGQSRRLDPCPWAVYDTGVRLSSDGNRVAIWGRYDAETDRVVIWDTAAGRPLLSHTCEDRHIRSLAFARDGRSLIIGQYSGRLAVIEIATGGERTTFSHRSAVWSAAISADGTRAVSCSSEAPVYVWDLVGDPGPWESDAVWSGLGSTEAKTGFTAIRKLRANPDKAVAFLKERIKVPVIPADDAVAKWLADLDAAAFADRERAQKELTAAPDLIRPKLLAARKGAPEETGRRLDQVLQAADGWTPDKLRQLRACEVLEGIRTPDAVRVLTAWAAGPDGSALSGEARASLARLVK